MFNIQWSNECYIMTCSILAMATHTRNDLLWFFKGQTAAIHVRFWTGKILLATTIAYAGAYYFKYNANVSTN